jgi:hypothetical protein
MVINNGDPITTTCCNQEDCLNAYLAVKQWYGDKLGDCELWLPPNPMYIVQGANLYDCPSSPPGEEHFWLELDLLLSDLFDNGTYRAFNFGQTIDFSHWPWNQYNLVYDVFDFTVDK